MDPGSVSLSQVAQESVARGPGRQAVFEEVEGLDGLRRQADVADGRTWAGGIAPVGEGQEVVFAVEGPGLGHFRQIMILGGQPEYGHGGEALLGKVSGETDGGEGLRDSKSRTAEKADLLAGDHGKSSGFAESSHILEG